MKKKRIYLSPPHMSGAELKKVTEVFKSNWIAPLGPCVDEFEKRFARYIGLSHAAALSSGTAALHLALRNIGVGKGDEVFCSDFTFCASAAPIIYEGACPVFIDADRTSWNMDPGILDDELKRSARRGKLPKAVIVVDLYGQSADMDPILASCERYGIPVIEDAAEALGAQYKGTRAGSRAYASVFSFNGNKIITTSGGGMLVSDDESFIRKARFLATQARDPAPHYQHSCIGYNYRMSNVLAAIGIGQLRVLERRVCQKRALFKRYLERLGKIPGLSFMPEPSWSKGNRWLTCIQLDAASFGATHENVRNQLEKRNIESRPLWKPMHLQPVFAHCRFAGGNVARDLFDHGLCLPSGTALTEKELSSVCGTIIRVHARGQR